jgi:uncharacterized repeat protein (TIGR03803 family)
MKLLPTILLLLLLTCCARAQALQSLFDFSADPVGVAPYTQLVPGPGNMLYGETFNGHGNSFGTVFGIKTDGTGFTNLFSFNDNDGAFPLGGVLLSGNTLYGTVEQGGSNGDGTVFAVNTDGTGFTNLYNFSGPDGSSPEANLALSGNTLYGTTLGGGSNGMGTVFAINTDGTGFSTLHQFSGPDGGDPKGGLIVSGSTIYGVTYGGGTNGEGSVFSIQTGGGSFTNLFSFHGYDGYWPEGGLVLSGSMLFGATLQGGKFDSGNVFGIRTDGTGFTNMYTFTGNKDGGNPPAGLVVYGHTLYGTASAGGSNNWGTVYAINTDSTGFTNVYDFTGGADGGAPEAGLLLVSNILYSTTQHGGTNSDGTIFRLTLPVPLPPPTITLHIAGNALNIAWPASATGYSLMSATSLTSPAGWSLVTNTPVVVNGFNTVTNVISGQQKFYYLAK